MALSHFLHADRHMLRLKARQRGRWWTRIGNPRALLTSGEGCSGTAVERVRWSFKRVRPALEESGETVWRPSGNDPHCVRVERNPGAGYYEGPAGKVSPAFLRRPRFSRPRFRRPL